MSRAGDAGPGAVPLPALAAVVALALLVGCGGEKAPAQPDQAQAQQQPAAEPQPPAATGAVQAEPSATPPTQAAAIGTPAEGPETPITAEDIVPEGGDAAGPGPEETVAPEGAATLPEVAVGDEPEGGFLAPENQRRVLLFFPDQSTASLVPEERIIFLTDTLTSQVKQAVSELIAGPFTEGLIGALPKTTELRGVFLPGTGVAVIDLGPEVLSIPAGSDWEQAALYSLTDTLVHNFPEIHRMQLLVEGQEIQTLAGHVDTSHPLVADMKRVEWSYERLLDEHGNFLRYEVGPELPDDWVPPPPDEPGGDDGEPGTGGVDDGTGTDVGPGGPGATDDAVSSEPSAS